MIRTVLACALILISSASIAETPYAGLQARQIKSLSEQQVADLKAGRGMGMALAAELNGYPGPAHVLRMSRSLLNIAKRPLPRLTLRGVGLTSKDAVS